MSYYDHPNCSNSTLSNVLRDIRGDVSPLPVEAFRKGTLLDAVVTEPSNLDLKTMTIRSTGEAFTKAEYLTCLNMEQALRSHPVASLVINSSLTQMEVYDHPLDFSFGGFGFSIPFKAKLDFFWPSTGVVSDLKSTSASTQEAFAKAAEMFQYYRQLYIYCRVTNASRAYILAVNWKAKVFVLELKKGDDNWKIAERHANELALIYYLTRM